MAMVQVGMREFRDKLATYLLETDTPVAITRHGDTVGYFLPARRKRTEAEKAALMEASEQWREMLQSEGISEEAFLEGFKEWRANRSREIGSR